MGEKNPNHNSGLLTGLTSTEVNERINAGKVNVSDDRTSRTIADILKSNILTRFNALLGVLCVVVLVVGSPADAIFGVIIFINSGIGIIQELRAKYTLDRLALLNTPIARVMRDGKLRQIPIAEVVLNDLMQLNIGDQIPADGKIITTDGLEVDESLLTGESESVSKKINNKVLSGSVVVAGQAFAEAIAVGPSAYVNQLAAQVKLFSRPKSELIDGINKLLTYISWVIVVIAPFLIWGQVAHSGLNWKEALVRSTGAITGMIPEGLVLLTSLAFVVAVLDLARRKVLIQQLPAVEGLARVDVICIDKTGTLTEGKIVFEELILLNQNTKEQVDKVLATFSHEPDSPTLQALHSAFKKFKIFAVDTRTPFSSARKWSSITTSKGMTWVLGAPEMVLADKDKAIQKQVSDIAKEGKRVIALLRAESSPRGSTLPKNMQVVGLIILSEKIRDDAKGTLEFFTKQGVTLKVISGDNPQTVAAVARRVGLNVAHPIDARSLPTNIRELAKIVECNNVFGRVTPEQKRAIIKALQSKGHIVAMTGDGVNDALALKDADIGIAMGNGAQATKATAQLVLLDSQFSHLPDVLAEGRRVIANIERVANLFVIKNVYSLILAISVTVVGFPYPFLPRHLTVLSTLTIGVPAFFLALAPNYQRYKPGFLKRVLRFAIPAGAVIGVLIFIAYQIVGTHKQSLASTMAATVVMVVGVWVLYCLARPLNWWKTVLVSLMPIIYIGLMSLPFARHFLNFSLNYRYLWYSLLLGVGGSVIIEVLWRTDKKTNVKSYYRSK